MGCVFHVFTQCYAFLQALELCMVFRVPTNSLGEILDTKASGSWNCPIPLYSAKAKAS